MELYFNSVTISIILDHLDRKDSLKLLSTCKCLRYFIDVFFDTKTEANKFGIQGCPVKVIANEE